MYGIGPQPSDLPYIPWWYGASPQMMQMMFGGGQIGRAEAERARADVMRTTVAPSVANSAMDFGNRGMGNSTFAGAKAAALQAEGARVAEDAAQDAIDRAYNRRMAEQSMANDARDSQIQMEDREREQREDRFDQFARFGQAGATLLKRGFAPSFSQPYANGPIMQGPSMFSQFGSAFGRSPFGKFGGGMMNGMFGTRF